MKRFTSLLLGVCLSSAAADVSSLADAFDQGKVSLNVRLRYEGVVQTSLLDANALTLRTRLGFTTAPLHGWKGMLEAENVAAYDGDSYSQAGLNPAAARRAVVGDPETSEINQVYVAYATGATNVTIGRQRLVLDNARFIGDVGWRQNQQTFDAAVVQDKSLPKTTLTYGFLQQVNRVFSERHAQGKWQSDSHVFNASYAGLPAGILTGYAYLLDFHNAAATSCASYGLSFTGATPLDRATTLLYRIEAARQIDYGSSPLSYRTSYGIAEAGVGVAPGTLSLGHEVLGSDHNVGFKTPLATLHALNGWADLFLATPAAGLRDSYLKATANLPAACGLTVFYHRFAYARGGEQVGTEWDSQLTRKFGKWISATAKWADYRRDVVAFPNVRKVWLMVDYAY
ncbi:MAG: alginate export family protein [Verrucomicrobiota bacterium]